MLQTLKYFLSKTYTLLSIGLFVFTYTTSYVSANQYSGTFDPDNAGYNKAYLVNDGDLNNISREITVGKFTTQSNQNGTITGNTITGWMWGAATGWISLNCANVANSCTSSDYKVRVNNDGYLVGYGWGPQAGWVNFSPTGAGANSARITSTGDFTGYAWSQVFGYISFNCSNDSSCGTTNFKTYTDFRPINYQIHAAVPVSFLQQVKNIFTKEEIKDTEVITENKKIETKPIEKISSENITNKTTNSKNIESGSGPDTSNFIPSSKPPEITKPVGSKEKLNKEESNQNQQNKKTDNTKKKVGLGILGLLMFLFIITRL